MLLCLARRRESNWKLCPWQKRMKPWRVLKKSQDSFSAPLPGAGLPLLRARMGRTTMGESPSSLLGASCGLLLREELRLLRVDTPLPPVGAGTA